MPDQTIPAFLEMPDGRFVAVSAASPTDLDLAAATREHEAAALLEDARQLRQIADTKREGFSPFEDESSNPEEDQDNV